MNLGKIFLKKKTILITRRYQKVEKKNPLILELTAEERTKLRCRRKTLCGSDLLLQLPREGTLLPGEILLGVQDSPQILITAAMENLLQVKANSTLDIMKAIYHLGNRHVDLELHSNEVYLAHDVVLKGMLLQRGLLVSTVKKSFLPEYGAYIENHKH
tara:strand:+ start:97 stop:570 length:474 start_codon:yes stop_codon:yes gene_type:complete